ncbi:rhodanese-like domain-containing protein [Maribacter arenosus]|uniref:Rhodanese-like domain-containing protein n=1 Tax=Maribacter arenosus TaxID=1854708 RepID=A0ABR7VCT2_9FLAO|nr:rhodanese-like domain-containing protein [Maribacter arenosus]MBD0850650.1 rhodanese-like domain-containing protein [Maribacter arenosus]
MRLVVLMAVTLLINLGCSQIKERHITEVSKAELDTVVLVDVRTPKEYNAGHLENSLNINWLGDSFKSDIQKIDKDKTIYVYCRSGKRSSDATRYLDSLGYKNVYNLRGGYIAYMSAKE